MRQMKIERPSKAATSRDEGRAEFVAESGQIPSTFLVASGMRYKLLKNQVFSAGLVSGYEGAMLVEKSPPPSPRRALKRSAVWRGAARARILHRPPM